MRPALASILAVAAMVLAGCSAAPGFDSAAEVEETGRTVDLKASVVDLAGSELYPGLKANLWAFCVEATDPLDSYSVKAVEHRDPLPGDAPTLAPELRSKCSVPGPTIRVQQGDRVIVRFANSHFHPHTMHWHGQFVPNEADGVPGVTQDTTPSGGSYTYEFIAKRAGTLWYHCHVDTQLHVMQGLYGMFIVEPKDQSWEPQDIDREYDLVFSTMRRERVEAIPGTALHNHPAGCASGFAGCENPVANVDPDVFLINGHSYPYTMEDSSSRIDIKPGERVRIRMLNAGTEVETIHPHGHDMLVTHKDGNPLPRDPPLYVDTLTIAPAERYDVVIEGNNPGVWVVHTHVNDHETNCGKTIGGIHSMIVYDGFQDKAHAFAGELPASCPYNSQLQPPPDYLDTRTFNVGTNTTVSNTFQFPIQLQCALRKVDFKVDLNAASTVSKLLTDLEVTLKDPAGTVLEVFVLGGQDGSTGGNITFEKRAISEIPAGLYTVQLSGQSFEASVTMSILVDYFEDLEDTKPNHALYGYAGCPGYT